MRTTIVTSQFRYIIILSMLICLRQSYAQTWSPGKNGNYSVRGGNAASYFNKNEGYFFIIGGRAEDRFLKTTQRYSASTDSWDTLAPHPTGLLGGAITTLNENIYIIGGVVNPPGFGQDTVYKFDIKQNVWSKVAPFPYDIVDAKAVTYQDSLIYVVGGLGGPDSANVLLYNANTNIWRKATTLPSPTALNFGGFACAGNKLIYMCGTDGFGSSNYFNSVYIGTIDVTNHSKINWKKGADFPGKTRSFFDALPWVNNTVIMTGGSTDNTFNTFSNECYMYDPSTDTWTQLPDKPTAWLTGHSGTVRLSNNEWELVCSQGFDSTFLKKTEILKQKEIPSSIKNEMGNVIFHVKNNPNPFSDYTNIIYTISEPHQHIVVSIYNALGELVETLIDEIKASGEYSIRYTPHGKTGIYYCKINSANQSAVVKIVRVN